MATPGAEETRALVVHLVDKVIWSKLCESNGEAGEVLKELERETEARRSSDGVSWMSAVLEYTGSALRDGDSYILVWINTDGDTHSAHQFHLAPTERQARDHIAQNWENATWAILLGGIHIGMPRAVSVEQYAGVYSPMSNTE